VTAADLGRLAEALAAADQPPCIFRALDELSGEVIGHRLFTIMRFDAERAEVERLYSNMPDVYRVGGRKKKADTDWANQILRDKKVYRANDAAGIRAAFDDHTTILGLGLESVLNIPVVFEGRCIGTMNLLHEAGWYRPSDDEAGVLLGSFLIPVLISR
jgi:GAF domain-containing protein